MAARPVYLDSGDIKSGNALFRASFGMNPKKRLYMDQIDVVEDETAKDEPQLARKMNVIVGKFKRKDYEGPKTPLIRQHMTFGGRAVFSTTPFVGSILPVARYVYAKLKSQVKRTGFFSFHVNYMVNGRQVRKLNARSVEGEDTVIAVWSRAEYAGVLDSPDATPAGRRWPRPTWKTFLAARRRYGDAVDLRYRYLNSDTLGYGPVGKTERASGFRTRPGRIYAVPVIEIASAGVLRGAGGGQPLKRRPKKSRRYGRYQLAAEFRRKPRAT